MRAQMTTATTAILLIAMAMSALAAPATVESDRIHWVQVAAFTTETEATALQSQLTAAGYSPVCIYPLGEFHTVRVGEFETYMDAYLAQQDLAQTYPDAWIRRTPIADERAAGREWNFTPLQAPEGPKDLFALRSRPMAGLSTLRFDDSNAPIRAGGRMTDSASEGWSNLSSQPFAPQQDLSPILGDLSSSTAGTAGLSLGRQRAQGGDLQGVREIALPVANGLIAASDQDRYESMWLMARSYHAMNWRRTAYRAYREIESICTDSRDLARCRVEQAGLLMELARSDSGRLADCRLACSRIIEEFGESRDSEVRQHVATAALMRAESYYFERDLDTAITELRQVIRDCSEITRESNMALHFLGLSLEGVGRFDEAMNVYEQLADRHLTEADNFPRQDLSQKAHARLISLALSSGHVTRAESEWADFQRLYPQSERIAELSAQFAALRRIGGLEAIRGIVPIPAEERLNLRQQD